MIFTAFNWKTMIIFAVILVAYFIGLGIFSLIKYLINKKKFKKEVEKNEKEKSE